MGGGATEFFWTFGSKISHIFASVFSWRSSGGARIPKTFGSMNQNEMLIAICPYTFMNVLYQFLRFSVLIHDRTTLYCIISNMKMIVQFHIFRPKFSHQNRLIVHELRTTTVKLNIVSQKQFLASTVVLVPTLVPYVHKHAHTYSTTHLCILFIA